MLLPALVACGGGYDYPDTRKDDVSEELHGVTVEDPYRWLEDDQAPEVLEWVDAQNEVTFDHLRSLPEREAIRTRLLELQDHARQSAPFRFGEQWFVRANDGLQDQDVLYRIDSPGEDPTGWEVLLDPNELSEDGTTSVGMTAFLRGRRAARLRARRSGLRLAGVPRDGGRERREALRPPLAGSSSRALPGPTTTGASSTAAIPSPIRTRHRAAST